MNSQANIFGANGARGRPDRIIRPDAFTLTALVGNTQQDRSGAIKRPMPSLTEIPEAVEIASGDAVVRSPKGAVRTDSEMCASHEDRGPVLQGTEAERDQFWISAI